MLTSTSYTSTVSYASTTVIWLPKGTTPNTGTAADNAVLGDIGELYNVWDDGKVTHGDNIPSHTGVGAWWSKDVAAGSTVTLGSLSYKLTELKKILSQVGQSMLTQANQINQGVLQLVS
ncbi:MAG: hypothetical protein II243_00345 [Lachnospiraceae bacterium]|nr:hypothetical protein [Lachnospiraceae bacterium]